MPVVKIVFKRWQSCGVHGKRRVQAYSWGPGAKPLMRGEAPAGVILISDAKNKTN